MQKTAHEHYLDAVRSTPVNKGLFSFVGVTGAAVDGRTPEVPEGDVDIVALPNRNVRKVGEFYIGAIDFFDNVNEEFRRRTKTPTSRCIYKHQQAPTRFLIKSVSGEKPLDVHTLMFLDRESFFTLNPPKFLEYLAHNSQAIHGDLQTAIQEMPNTPDKKKLEAMIMLWQYNVLQTADNFPRQLTLEQTQELTKYFSKIYGIKITPPKNVKDCKKIIKELALEVDKADLITPYTTGEYN